jgi:hypothetical protein
MGNDNHNNNQITITTNKKEEEETIEPTFDYLLHRLAMGDSVTSLQKRYPKSSSLQEAIDAYIFND